MKKVPPIPFKTEIGFGQDWMNTKRTKRNIPPAPFSMLSLALLFVLLLSTGSASASQGECSVTCSETPASIETTYGCYTTGPACQVAPVTDHDNFHFVGSADDQVRITIRSQTNCFDPRLEIRDPNGASLLDTYCAGENVWGCLQCTIQENVTLPLSGTYTITISDSGADEQGNYLMQLEKVPPPYDPLGLGYDAPQTDLVTPSADTDFLDFEGETGSQIRVTVRSKTDCFDPRLEIRDPNGASLLDTYCAGENVWGCLQCTIQEDFTLSQTGTYLIALSDSYADETGTYEIDLQCLFGDCPLCIDEDGDGFGDPGSPHCRSHSPQLDCDDTDPNTHPGATETSGDGIDSNCNGQDDCFIATAAFGTELTGKIDVLRKFRDTYLLTNSTGRAFVDFYYTHSPPVADFIAQHEWMRILVRFLLLPVVGVVSLLV